MKTLTLILCTVLFLLSCKKDKINAPAPVAAFTIDGQYLEEFKMATHEAVWLVDSSKNADSVRWDFGNGVVSRGHTVALSYEKSGVYTLTQTVTNAEGKTSTASKKITILDRVLKRVVIQSVYWDPVPDNIDHFNYVWPQTTTASVYMQFNKYKEGDSVVPRSGLLPNSPVLFTSSVVQNVPNEGYAGITMPDNQKFIIDMSMIEARSLQAFLVAKDKSGNVFNLTSTNQSGNGYNMTANFKQNKWTLSFGILSSVRLEGDFE
jgi:PKD repeat protein